MKSIRISQDWQFKVNKMKEYWVIGGEFTSINFHSLKYDAKEIFGPFTTRVDAEQRWREESNKTKFKALIRYRIVTVDNTAAE